MPTLDDYAKKSPIMDITIKLGNETFSFNLYKELVISEANINREIKGHTNPYAFLKQLQKKLLLLTKECKMEIENVKAEVYLSWKKKINSQTGKPYNEDFATAKSITDKKVRLLQHRLMKLESNYNDITTCVEGFEVRKDLIQTLSANARRENS